MESVSRRTPTREVRTTRAERGHRLAFERFEEIVMLRPGVYFVPASSGDHGYLVDIKRGTCSCEDRVFRALDAEPCKHVFAARIVHARTTTCEGCGERVRRRDAVEVGDDHLTFFEGDLVCPTCSRNFAVC